MLNQTIKTITSCGGRPESTHDVSGAADANAEAPNSDSFVSVHLATSQTESRGLLHHDHKTASNLKTTPPRRKTNGTEPSRMMFAVCFRGAWYRRCVLRVQPACQLTSRHSITVLGCRNSVYHTTQSEIAFMSATSWTTVMLAGKHHKRQPCSNY